MKFLSRFYIFIVLGTDKMCHVLRKILIHCLPLHYNESKKWHCLLDITDFYLCFAVFCYLCCKLRLILFTKNLFMKRKFFKSLCVMLSATVLLAGCATCLLFFATNRPLGLSFYRQIFRKKAVMQVLH